LLIENNVNRKKNHKLISSCNNKTHINLKFETILTKVECETQF